MAEHVAIDNFSLRRYLYMLFKDKLDGKKTAKRPARSISGEIISYDVDDADSNEESSRSQKSECISNERSDVRQSPSIPKNAKEKDDDLEFDMKTKWQI